MEKEKTHSNGKKKKKLKKELLNKIINIVEMFQKLVLVTVKIIVFNKYS